MYSSQLLLITGCTREYFISLDPTLTPPDLIQASNAVFSLLQEENVLSFGCNENGNIETWCTDKSDFSPSINITFSEPVMITSFLSSGTGGFQSNNHTTNFTVEYMNTSSSQFVYYSGVNSNVNLYKLFNDR